MEAGALVPDNHRGRTQCLLPAHEPRFGARQETSKLPNVQHTGRSSHRLQGFAPNASGLSGFLPIQAVTRTNAPASRNSQPPFFLGIGTSLHLEHLFYNLK